MYPNKFKINKIKIMKKILGLVLVLAIFVACKNETKTTETTAVETPTVTYTEGDVIKKDGKVQVYKDGSWAVVEQDVTLDNGVVIKTTGEVVAKDGKIITLEEGSFVNKAGNFFDKTGAAVENAWDATKEGLDKAADVTKDAVKDAANATAEGLDKAADATKDAVKDAASATKEGLNKAADATKDAANKVADKTKKVVEEIKK